MERACALLRLNQETFLTYCVMQGIEAAEAKAGGAKAAGSGKSPEDVTFLENLYRLKDSRPDKGPER